MLGNLQKRGVFIIIMKFGTVLRECLNSSNSSVRNFSEVTGINRGWVYNIFNGKKSLPQDRFLRILSTYPFTINQKNSLIVSYYSDLYGAENFQKIQYIISSLNDLSVDACENVLPLPSKKYTMQSESLSDTASIIDAATYLLNGITDLENPFIYTNFSYGQEKINDIFYFFLSQNKEIKYYHLVNFDTAGIDIHNLRNIFISIKYASLGYSTYYHYNNFSTPLQIDNIFPFFITTNKGVLLYDTDAKKGFILTEPSILKSFIAKNESLFLKASPLVTFHRDALTLNSQLKKSHFFDGSLTNISYYPPIPYFFDKNTIWERLYNSGEKRHLTDIFQIFFELLSKNLDMTFLLHIDGLKDFCHQRSTPFLPDTLSESTLKSILNTITKQYTEEKNIYFVDDKIVSFPKNISITANNSSVLFMGASNNKEYIGNYHIYLDNPIIANDFKMFKDYVIKNQYCYNDTYMMHVLNNLSTFLFP